MSHIQDDRGSVKSDQIHSNEMLLGGMNAGSKSSLIKSHRNNLPLLPKAREDAIIGRTNSLPDNVLLQEEKLRQQ